MKSFKEKFDKISLATEEKLHSVKSALKKKLNENEKQELAEKPDNTADLLQGWTMLGDKNTKNKNVEFDADFIEEPQPPPQQQQPHALPILPVPQLPSPVLSQDEPVRQLSSSGSFKEIPLVAAPFKSDIYNVNRNSVSNNNNNNNTNQSLKNSFYVCRAPHNKQMDNIGGFSTLSTSIIWNIMALVDAYALCQLARVSVDFYKLSTNEFLWERLYIKMFHKSGKVDKALWYEQSHHGGYRSLFGTKLCEEQMAKTLRSMHNQQNTPEHNAVEWICKPLVSVQSFFTTTEAKLVMLGLSGSGKTSILYKLFRGEAVKTESTIGFNHETIEHKGYEFDIWDLVHKPSNPAEFWRTYFPNTNGIIFVVDGNDREKLPQARACLEMYLAEPLLADLPLLVYVNKRDVVESMSTLQVLVGLNLHYLCNKSGWHIQPCSTVENDLSLEDGLDWFCNTFKQDEVQRLKTKIVSAASSDAKPVS